MNTTETLAPLARQPAFPSAEVQRRLRVELEKIAAQTAVLRAAWDPLLDSMQIVGVVLLIEDLFPFRKIPPDKAVRRGGYSSVNEAVDDMCHRIEDLMMSNATQAVGK